MAFKSGYDPNRNYGGRPKGSGNKKLTKSEMQKLNELLDKLTGEAIEVIVEAMRDTNLPSKERVGAAKYIVSTKVSVDQVLERRKNGQEDDEDEDQSDKGTVINLVWSDKFKEEEAEQPAQEG